MTYSEAQCIMGKNFIGPEEFASLSREFPVRLPARIPDIPYDATTLKRAAKDCVLVLGIAKLKNGTPLTLNAMRDFFGKDPAEKEPCLYNQDWYLKERFARSTTLKNRWYLLQKRVSASSRGARPDVLEKQLKRSEQFPLAILTAFTFFAWYFLHRGDMLWKHDFVWCRDRDKNGDRIYTGRYVDPKKINKNGFNIHRHLSIRPCYGAVIER